MTDILEQIAAKVRELRDLEHAIARLAERLKDANAELRQLTHGDLVDLFDTAEIDRLGINAEGNYPAFDAKLSPFYSANIAASWPAPKRQQAFNYLEHLGAGDLIKTVVEISWPREQHTEAKKFVDLIAPRQLAVSVKESVSHQTLTAWLKARCEADDMPPNLDIIGAQVGRVVTLKERK